MQENLDIIATALMNYVNDSAGEGSDEAKEIHKAWRQVYNRAKVDTHDVGMIASVISVNMWEEIYEALPGGSMTVHDYISRWAEEFHRKYEGVVSWGEEDLSQYGFVNSDCWDEAVCEFIDQKLHTK